MSLCVSDESELHLEGSKSVLETGASSCENDTSRRGEKVLYESDCGDDRAMQKRVSKPTEKYSDCLHNQHLIPRFQRIKAHRLTSLPYHVNTAHCQSIFTPFIAFTQLFHDASHS